MSSIGIVMRVEGDIDALADDGAAVPLGARPDVLAVVARHLDGSDPSLALALSVEDADAPRTITASGVWGDREVAVLRAICEDLHARFYDPEDDDFIDLDS